MLYQLRFEASLEAGQVWIQFIPIIWRRMTWCVYDKDHMSALWMKNTSESDPHSYEVTLAVKNSPENILRLQFCWSVYNWLLSCWNRLQTSVKWFFLSLFFLLWKDDQIFLSGRQPLVNWAKTCIAKFNVMVSTLKYSVSFLVFGLRLLHGPLTLHLLCWRFNVWNVSTLHPTACHTIFHFTMKCYFLWGLMLICVGVSSETLSRLYQDLCFCSDEGLTLHSV